MPSQREPHAVAPRPDSVPTRFSVVLRELARIPEPEDASAWDRVLAAGAVVDKYELVREIGRGGFGVVWEAWDADLGRSVAFKAVRGAGPRSEAEGERLFREAEAAARLSHPNIVTLFDVGRGEAGAYLVLEHLRGRTLAQRLDEGPVPVAEALRIAVDVAKALAHAHENGVVHRDLAPGNVFLCDEGHVKVLDFGMAHAFGRRRLDGGTPGYMAPEQRRGAPEDERTDVFALGVILHRMLSGELPFPDGARRSAPVPLLEVGGVPGLGELVARMLAEDPVQRPRDGREVLEALSAAADAVQRTTSSGTLPAARKRRRGSVQVAMGVAAGAAIALAAVCGGNAAGIWRAHRPSVDAAAPSIAVLPFADLSEARDKEYFSDGLADEILNALARVDGLRVPSRTSSFYFKGKSARLQDIGRELGVQTILEGSVRTMGNRVRVTAQVVDASDGHRIWGQIYDREVTDVFAVQAEIAHAVVEALDARLLAAKADGTGLHATDNPEVYAQYLIGRQQYHRLTREGYQRAVEAYEKALALDPKYAPAWAGVALPVFYLAGEGKTPAEFESQRRRALDAARKAVELSPELPDALSTRGVLRALVEYDWGGAKQDLERALALAPNDADTRRRYGTLLAFQGRLAEGTAELRKAVQLDPLGQSWGTLGALYQESGDLDLSVAAYQRHLQLVPGSAPGMFGFARTQLLQAKPADALATISKCPADDYKLWVTAIAQHALGHRGEAKAALDALTSKHAHTSALRIAEVYAWLGDKEAAFAWLDRALAEPGVTAPSLRTSPFLRALHADPRFSEMLVKLHLPPL